MFDLLILAAAAASAPKPQNLKTFTDWIVGCDNGRACQAVALLPQDDMEGTTMVIWRGPEAMARPTITINADYKDATGIVIDGKRQPFALRKEGEELIVDRTQSAALIAAMLPGKTMTVVDARGKQVGTPSLSGLSAALLYMDEQQRRIGTVTALVRKGAKPASAVPPTPALPVIVSPKAPKLLPRKLTPVDMKRELKSLECETTETSAEPTYARLDARTTLAILPLPCGNGAYNYFAYALLIDNAGKVRPARFDAEPGMGGESSKIGSELVNGDWDTGKRLVTTYSKGRGLGDCGAMSKFAWDGQRFRLAQLEVMGECRGSTDYITTWRAAVR